MHSPDEEKAPKLDASTNKNFFLNGLTRLLQLLHLDSPPETHQGSVLDARSPLDPRSPEDEIVKFCRNGQSHTILIWDIQRVHCEYVRDVRGNPLMFGSARYYEVYLTSGEFIKLSEHDLEAAYPESPNHNRLYIDSDRLYEATKVPGDLSNIDRIIRKGGTPGAYASKYSDWIQERYQVNPFPNDWHPPR